MPYYGENLDGFLKKRKDHLQGIINGIDSELYNPASDPNLSERYQDYDGKRENKTALQRLLNLPVNKEMPILSMVTRLVDQKGMDLVLAVLDDLIKLKIQVVILGTGEEKYEEAFSLAAERYPDNLSVQINFDDALARKIYAGSDLFLMPSQFEPCGIGQLIALRYGTLPVVRETGGLRDTVEPYNEFTDEGNGFSFTSYNAHDMLHTIERAVWHYRFQPEKWKKLVSRAMNSDYSWEASSQKYKKIYEELLE
jgi:starch synthase